TEAGVSGPGVVDRQPYRRAESLQLAPQARVVVDLDVLRDLEHDRSADRGQDLAKPAGQDELRRRVEAQVAVLREVLARRDRGTQARVLELDAETGAGCLGKDDVWGSAIGEPGEGLVTDDRAVPQVDDRLEVGHELSGLDHGLEGGPV